MLEVGRGRVESHYCPGGFFINLYLAARPIFSRKRDARKASHSGPDYAEPRVIFILTRGCTSREGNSVMHKVELFSC